MISRLRDHPSGLHLGLMLALTFSTGVVDAVGYLGLDRVFTGNMTGNVVILAMALTGAGGLPIIGPLIALACFLAGAAAAGRVFKNIPAGWYVRTTVLLSAVAALLVIASVLDIAIHVRTEALAYVVTGMLGLAMGAQAGSARHIGVADVTTVVVTSTLVGLAFDSRFGGGKSKHPWQKRSGAILLLALGAASGALLLRANIGYGTLLAAVVTIVVVVLGTLGRPHPVEGDPTN
jgi:uncharacterized membrane protein YoaK (UPF0700 family)